jgi:TDG/mug DNA glycosylase family protein
MRAILSKQVRRPPVAKQVRPKPDPTQRTSEPDGAAFESLRLKDCVRPPVRVLFVGINPGVRSAVTGHHFAGFSNRFWNLLFESGLVPERLRADEDRRLPEWGYGITNLVARPSPGIDTLTPDEYTAGIGILRRKVRRWRPKVVAFVGVTLYRAIFDARGPITLGMQRQRLEDARVFVLPNPSGRNANYSYAEMLAAFRALRRAVGRTAL